MPPRHVDKGGIQSDFWHHGEAGGVSWIQSLSKKWHIRKIGIEIYPLAK